MYKANIPKFYLANFLLSLHFFGGVLIPFFTLWGGLTLSQVFFLETWFLVWSVILEVPTGIIADRFGRKVSLFLGALTVAVGSLVYSSIPILSVFLLGEFLFALALAFQSGADHAFIFDSLKADHREIDANHIVGKSESVGLLAMTIAAPIGSLIGGSFGPRFAMMAFSLPALLGFLTLLTLKEPPRGETISESRRFLDIFKKGIAVISGRRKIQWIALDLAVVYSLSFLMIWLYQPLLMKLAIPLVWFGFIHIGLTLSQIVALHAYPKLEKIFSSRKLLSATAILPAIFFLVIAATKSLPIAIASMVIVTGLGLTRQPLVTRELNEMIPGAQRATVLSFVNLSRRLLRAIVMPIAGLLADRSLPLAFSSIGVVLLVFFLFRTAVLSVHESPK